MSPKTWDENGLLSEIFETRYFGTTRCRLPYLVIAKYIVSIFSESKAFRSMFWVLFVSKYSKLTI